MRSAISRRSSGSGQQGSTSGGAGSGLRRRVSLFLIQYSSLDHRRSHLARPSSDGGPSRLDSGFPGTGLRLAGLGLGLINSSLGCSDLNSAEPGSDSECLNPESGLSGLDSKKPCPESGLPGLGLRRSLLDLIFSSLSSIHPRLGLSCPGLDLGCPFLDSLHPSSGLEHPHLDSGLPSPDSANPHWKLGLPNPDSEHPIPDLVLPRLSSGSDSGSDLRLQDADSGLPLLGLEYLRLSMGHADPVPLHVGSGSGQHRWDLGHTGPGLDPLPGWGSRQGRRGLGKPGSCSGLIMLRLLFLLLLFRPVPCGSVQEHDGVCPNKLNTHLWVDAQSTCERECGKDEDCAVFEKCCTNVCGLLSCVAARFPDDDSSSHPDSQSGPGAASASSGVMVSCDGFLCNQQGAVCDMWEGQPVCKCQDRCESEPSFTCASDGLTYFNRCYMDAEACIQGITLTVVTCRYHVSGPHSTSPLPPGTTAQPTPAYSAPFPPTLYSNPQHQVVYLGGTATFHCDVVGHPKPDITWEKASERQERLVMKPDQMYDNVVITNIGQLVVYNAQVWDTGIYTCIARNSAGELRADYPLSVVRNSEHDFYEEAEVGTGTLGMPFSPADCLVSVERGECGENHVDWHYDTTLGTCQPFTHGGCPGGRNRFETFEECRVACQREGLRVCTLPAVQGPCRNWEARWAYNAISKQCQAFVFGGCHGNSNNFQSKAECEANCPRLKSRPCRGCRPKGRMVTSLCRSDFAIVGRLTELIEDLDSGIAHFSLQQVLRDEKMGLQLFKARHLEVTLPRMDWSCPCPNITVQEGPLLVMGQVQDGMAVVFPDSYVRPISDRKIRKIQEVVAKKTCEMLQRFQD